MRYRRMPIEVESPEQLGYGRIRHNLAESSVTDAALGDLGVDLDGLVLQYGDHLGLPELRAEIAADGEELTAKIFKRHYRVYEVPITYDGRNYDEGKKITWRDGFVALWVLLKYRFTE